MKTKKNDTAKGVVDNKTNYIGRNNSTKAEIEKDLVENYYVSMLFFKELEEYHQESAQWYFNEMRLNEAKAGKHLDKVELAHVNYLHYQDLISMALVNGFSFQQGVNHV